MSHLWNSTLHTKVCATYCYYFFFFQPLYNRPGSAKSLNETFVKNDVKMKLETFFFFPVNVICQTSTVKQVVFPCCASEV